MAMRETTGRRRLILMRHAKSSWAETGLADFDRPLNGRGRSAAKAMGAHLAAEGHAPDLILCSSARRALETLCRVLPFLPGDREVRVTRALYSAGSADALLRLVRATGEAHQSMMVIGHNPVLEDLVVQLAGRDSGRCLAALTEKFPTGAAAVLDHDCAWSALGPGDADLVAFKAPRALE